MTTPTTYSMETVSLTPTTDGHATSLTVTASSSIMTNYEPSRSVDSQHHIGAIEDVNGNPIIFSLGTNNHLYAIVHSNTEKTGWAQFDVTEKLSPASTVAAFDVARLPNKRFAVVATLTDGNKPTFYATPALSADPQAPFWGAFSEQFIDRPSTIDLKAVSTITTGPSDSDDYPAIIALATQDGTNYDRYVVKGDTKDVSDIWKLWPLPQNAHRNDNNNPIASVVIGKAPNFGMSGTYSLYFVGDDLQMTFDTLGTLNGQTLSHPLSVPPGAANLSAVATDSSGFTELFVAGTGVYRFTLDAQRSGQEAIKIADSLKADARTELQVLADSKTLSVWFLDQGVLSYVQGAIGATPNWTTPMPLKKDVGQIAALRNTVRNTNELFDVDASEQLTYFYQDPVSTLWKQQLIALADVGKAIPFQCYTTVIHFADQDGIAWSQEVQLSATGWIYVTVNGQAHILDQGTSTTVTPDASGSITVISKIATTSTPVLTFGSTGFKEVFDVNPQWVVNDNLKRYKTGQSVSGGKTQNGKPILGGNSKISADQFSSTVNHFTAASDAASSTSVTVRKPGSQPSNRVDPGKLQATALAQSALSAFAVTDLASGTPRMLMGSDAMALVPSPKIAIHPAGSVGGDIEAFFGDVWSAIYTGLKEVDTWVLNVTEEGLQFVVHLAEGVATFILDTIEKIYEALAWVLQKIEMALDKFIQWLGQLLGWDDIIKTHKVIANGVNQLFDWASTELSGLQTQIDKTFDTAATTLTGHALPPDIATQSPRGASNGYQSKQSKDVQKKSDYPKSPAGSFSSYHVKHSGPSDSDASVEAAFGKALADFLSTAETAGSDIYGTVKNVLQDIMKGLSDGSMTLEQIFQKVVNDIVSGVLQTTRDVINGVIQVVGDLVSVIKAVLNKSIDIPFITALYKLITGDSELTLLNLFSFILAIPATVMLKIAGAGAIFDDLMGLDDKNKTPTEFMALISQQNPSLSAAAVENFENSAAVKYSYIGGAVFIVAEIIGDVLATAKAAGASLGKFVAWIRALIQAIITGATFPAIRDPAYEWRLIAWCVKLGLLASAFALAKEGSDSAKKWGGMNIALGITGTIAAIAIPITNQLADAATDLTWMALVGNLGNNLGGFVGSGIAVFDPVPGTKNVLAVVAGVGFAIKVIMDGTRWFMVVIPNEGKAFYG